MSHEIYINGEKFDGAVLEYAEEEDVYKRQVYGFQYDEWYDYAGYEMQRLHAYGKGRNRISYRDA